MNLYRVPTTLPSRIIDYTVLSRRRLTLLIQRPQRVSGAAGPLVSYIGLARLDTVARTRPENT